MGITGLIPFLDKASCKVHLKDLRGKTVAVDSYCWLHKGVYSCAEKLVRGEDCDQYITYCLKYVQMLLSYNIKPIMVFDGQHLPAKALTEKRRRESRQESKKRAKELLRLGKVEQARSHMRRCVDITHEMALRLIKECRVRNVDCIVAPYEADAQMAWLNKVGIAHFVITEDSDLTLFGARKIIFKLDLSGCGLLVESEKLHLAMGCNEENYNFEKFRRMCILSGCDYLDSLPGIGLAKSCKFMLKTEQEDMNAALKKIPQVLNMKQLQVDDEYIENFHKAEATFKHMYIFNAFERKMERLNALEDYQTDEKYCSNAGSPLEDNKVALHLALGNLNPFSFKQLDDWLPENGLPQLPRKDIKRAKHKSIWLTTTHQTVRSNESCPEKTKPKSSALYFKKIDFVSNNIEQVDSENLKAENSKPAESDVMALYKEEVSASKRKRRNSDEYETRTHQQSPSSSTTPKQLLHNPFIKIIGNSMDKEETTVPICANASLLKVLSPSKIQQETRRLRSFTRNLNMIQNEQVEVRSRFFAKNIKLAKQSESISEVSQNKTIAASTTDVSEEIENIERLSQQRTQIQAMLYHSPSPQKSIITKYDDQNLIRSDSGIESLATSENNDIISNQLIETTNIKTNIIELSDEDSTDRQDVSSTKKSKIITGKQRKTPRLGLSKSKAKIQKKKSTQNAISPKKNSSSETQMSLSMFGFQKRPTLT